VGECDGVRVAVAVGVREGDAVAVGVSVTVGVCECEGVAVAVSVLVAVPVCVGGGAARQFEPSQNSLGKYMLSLVQSAWWAWPQLPSSASQQSP